MGRIIDNEEELKDYGLIDNIEYFCHKQSIIKDCYSENTLLNIDKTPSIIILIEQDFKGIDYLTIRLEASESADFKNCKPVIEQTINKNDLKAGACSEIKFAPREILNYVRLKFSTGDKICISGLMTAILKREECNILTERKFLIHTDEYSIGEDGMVDSKVPLTNVCYELALQLKNSKEELEQYKKSKQASYESMQREWNDTINKLRDTKTELHSKVEFIQEQRQIIDDYKKEINMYKQCQGKRACKREERLKQALEEIKSLAELEVIVVNDKAIFPANIQRIIDTINEVLDE